MLKDGTTVPCTILGQGLKNVESVEDFFFAGTRYVYGNQRGELLKNPEI